MASSGVVGMNGIIAWIGRQLTSCAYLFCGDDDVDDGLWRQYDCSYRRHLSGKRKEKKEKRKKGKEEGEI